MIASSLWFGRRLSPLLVCALSVALWPPSLTSSPAAVVQEPEWSVEDPGGPTTLLEYTASEGTWLSVDVSPDGQRIAFDLLGHIYEMPVAGGDARRLTDGRSWNLSPRYSPDGSRLAFTSDHSGSSEVYFEVAAGVTVVQSNLGLRCYFMSPQKMSQFPSAGLVRKTIAYSPARNVAMGTGNVLLSVNGPDKPMSL